MDHDLIRRWVEALRSGQYKQGQGLMKYVPNGESEPLYCCLGVLCEVAGVTLNSQRKGPQGLVYGVIDQNVKFYGAAYEAMPPDEVLLMVGLGEFGRPEADPRSKWHYSTMNDNGCSFEEIADKLEATFLS